MPNQVVIPLPEIRSGFDGFSALIEIAHQTESLSYTNVVMNLASTSWFDANMCAPFGAILYRLSRRLNLVRFENVPYLLESLLQKNGFLSFYGAPKKSDYYGTTIQYNRFETKDDRFFGAYIEQHFKDKAIPRMSDALRKKFWESIFELFNNAVTHSESKMGIFTCGQYFPRKKRIDFAIADLGIGIPRNLVNKKGLHYSPDEAINWAMEGRNTTKTGPIPGGLGLKLLREFIRLNQGRIQVVSDVGYWEQRSDGTVDKRTLLNPFPGTVVNIEINTADMSSYVLSSELPQDIF